MRIDQQKARLALGYAAGIATYATHDLISYNMPVIWFSSVLASAAFLGVAVYSVGVLLERSFGRERRT
jgi:hypothetical protein